MTGGMDAEKLRRQFVEIDEIRRAPRRDPPAALDGDRHPGRRGARPRGRVHRELDLVLVSIHSRFQLSRDSRRSAWCGRSSTRRSQSSATPSVANRPPPGDRRRCRRRAPLRQGERRRHGAQRPPERLDLSDTNLIKARELGVKLSISTDAHKPAAPRPDELRHRAGAARLADTPAEVLNCPAARRVPEAHRPRPGRAESPTPSRRSGLGRQLRPAAPARLPPVELPQRLLGFVVTGIEGQRRLELPAGH